MSIRDIQKQVDEFASARDWEQFHNPKNLVMALTGEVGELTALFQWLPSEECTADRASDKLMKSAESEMADVFIYLVRLADKLGIDLEEAARRKIELNEERYPVEKSKGSARKYDEL